MTSSNNTAIRNVFTRQMTRYATIYRAGLLTCAILFSGCTDPADDPACVGVNIEELRSAAEIGLVEAQHEFAQRYESGECIGRDFGKAAHWYQQAAEQGNTDAQKALGFMYAGGMGVDRDDNLSLIWFKKAAKNGHPEAQFGLATAYFRGIGVEKNPQTAASWFRRSANQNFARSQYNLGNLYETGQGVPQDLIQAYLWYGLANANHYGKAEKAIIRLEQQLSPEMLDTARLRIRSWEPKTQPLNTDND